MDSPTVIPFPIVTFAVAIVVPLAAGAAVRWIVTKTDEQSQAGTSHQG